jgi:hypothetical protein
VMAVDKTWCPEHFVCANPNCRRSLVDVGFVEEQGQLLCEKDYELYFAPHCARCDVPIVGVRLFLRYKLCDNHLRVQFW